jgi:retron-type reverse transcriptase
MTRPTTRQELYDRIRESSKDQVIIEEMIRLGFWPRRGQLPEDPADDISREVELENQLRALRTEASRLGDVERLRREARKRRLLESREKREATKERRLRERRERKRAWAKTKAGDITFLGTGYSGGLLERTGDVSKLARFDLPSVHTPAELAEAMGIEIPELRFLTFARQVSRVSHYARFRIPKKSGGERLISAPMPRLKKAQHWVLRNICDRLSVHESAHGFRADRSIVSGARPHVGAAVVVNVDLEDFFPTVGYRRVRGMFRSLGYSEAVATLLALLCTEPAIEVVELDGEAWYVGTGERALPQGAPTSPAITNRICRRMDHRLTVAATKLGFVYTRYADDLSFSAESSNAPVARLLRQVEHIAVEEGFRVHPKKTRVFRRGRRQEVTGLVVNDKLGVPRRDVRRLRAVIYQIEKDGPEGKTWPGSDDPISGALGFASFVAMVDPDRGRPLHERAMALAKKHGRVAEVAPAKTKAPKTEGETDAESAKKKKKWWKLF